MRQLLAVSVLALAVLTGCGGGSTSAESEPSKAPVMPDCRKVDAGLAKAIIAGEENPAGLKAVKWAAVKSPDFYFIAIEFSATGVDNQLGVWASDSLKQGGEVIMSVDSTAKAFTVWPDADETDAEISDADPSIDAAKACLG